MNRIYQGKVTRIETLKPGKKGKAPEDWQPLENWQAALWQHHELFQDAVNYYTLALAAMVEGLQPDSNKGRAAFAWQKQVSESWLVARRKAVSFSGPHQRLAKWLHVNANSADAKKAFDTCAKALLKDCKASTQARAKALLQLLEEADQSDLNQLCVSRLPWFCTPKDQLDATPSDVASDQRNKMIAAVHVVHNATEENLAAAVRDFDQNYFVTKYPEQFLTGESAGREALRLFSIVADADERLAQLRARFEKRLDELGDTLRLAILGRRPSGAYPLAAIFKIFPDKVIWETLKEKTRALNRQVAGDIQQDYIAQARVDDQPLFDYFTNIVFKRDEGNTDRAVWFEYDLAAFIEAIKAPHRYFQDTLTREKDAEKLRKRIAAMEGGGGDIEGEHEEDEDGTGTFGFKGDERVTLLVELVFHALGFIGEVENPEDARIPRPFIVDSLRKRNLTVEAGRIEYTIQERTLRGFEEVKEQWRKLAGKGQATEAKLLEVLAEQQTKHRDDFGSATLYRELAKPEYHSIWLADGTEKWHAADLLKAWRAYKELCFELDDKERKIRFTPADPEYSRRYFIIPKQGRFGSDHQPGVLALTCGMVLNTPHGLEAVEVRLTYAAPRLRRDELRRDGKEDLESVPWLQPMMKALGFSETDQQDFANCRVTLQPQKLKPSRDQQSAERYNIQLTFPVEVSPEKLIASLGKASLWNRQFNLHPDGDNFYNASLRWPHEKQPAKPPVPWHEQTDFFRCAATDLGQRDAGAYARLIANCNSKYGKKPSRLIGATQDKQWRTAVERTGLFRLPGEDAQVWRERSAKDTDDEQEGAFREELWGERGRPARTEEADETAELMRRLEAPPEDKELTLLPENWRTGLSFPEQNDKLLVAIRRYQSRIARLHRWCWFLKGDDKQKGAAKREIAECADERVITAEIKGFVEKDDPRGFDSLTAQLKTRLGNAPEMLVRIANRILPLRGRSWQWECHPEAKDNNRIHLLTQNGPRLDGPEHKVWLRGQRGLSMERIEQIEELRKRFQSLNQTLRRDIGGKPPIRRDESVPDPCPVLLDKLEHIKEQRVNQTAHMILAEALGLHLSQPPVNKKALKAERDQHGVYEKILDKQHKWIGPVDFIVIEDLSRYRASQGRAPRENSRLMKWCHRAVRDKLKQLCEVFGLPVLETPAAYSSRFCSRTGVPGFRAVEVMAGFENKPPWCWLKDKQSDGRITEEAEFIRRSADKLHTAQAAFEASWKPKHPGQTPPRRTLLIPQAGGPIFVPAKDFKGKENLSAAVAQADINAAINLALRAIADPRLWDFHPRLRTERIGGEQKGRGDKRKRKEYMAQGPAPCLKAREKRKYGMKDIPLEIGTLAKGSALEGTRNPNYFYDVAGIAHWDKAKIGDPLTDEMIELVSGKAMWGEVKALQWKRCGEINVKRVNKWNTIKH